jgi:hypothetical protein
MELNLPNNIEHRVKDDWRILFHGTSQDIEAFSEHAVGQGGDDNSALGVHLTDHAHHAAEYAQMGDGEGVVLIVMTPGKSPFTVSDHDLFFGLGEDGSPDPNFGRAGFSEWRQELLSQGHDVVDYEDGNGPITVALDPAKLLVVGRLSVDKAIELGEMMDVLEDSFSTSVRVDFLRSIMPTQPVFRSRRP